MTSLYQRMIEDNAKKKLQWTEGNDLKHRSKHRKKWQREELKDFEKKNTHFIQLKCCGRI